MAGLCGVITFDDVQTVSSAKKTIALLGAPANQRVRIYGFSISGQGVVATDPDVIVYGYMATSNGTGGRTATPAKRDRSLAETIQSTGLVGPASGAWTAEPTYAASGLVYENGFHPQGNLPVTFYFGTELWIKGGEYFALVLNSGSGAVLTPRGDLKFEE